MDFIFAYLAGVLTLINPCVIPVLPIVIAGALGENKFGPLALVAGLSLSFTIVGVTVAAFGPALGIDEDIVSRTSAMLMIFLGILILIPTSVIPASLTNGIANAANQRLAELPTQGLTSQFLGGALLGAAWAPCIGPTLGGALALAYEQSSIPFATGIMLVFSLGVATIMLSIAYGTKSFVARFNALLRYFAQNAKLIIGTTFLIMGLTMFFKWHRKLEEYVLELVPEWLISISTML